MTSVLFIDGTAGFYPQRLKEKPTGGIITSMTLIPQYLAGKGLLVAVASEYEGPSISGVEYVRNIREQDKAVDVVVFNRNTFNHEFLDMFPDSKKVWWLHDIVDYRYMQDDSYHRIDRIVSLSNYCTASYSDFYGIAPTKFVRIPNGVDTSVFYPDQVHDPNLYVLASATIKGLYPVSFTLSNLKRCNPRAELRIYSGQALHDLKDGERESQQLKQLTEEGATVVGPVPQAVLARAFREAQAVLMPNHYPEICSNILLQAQASGAPVVATNIGSAGEFITHGLTGMLTKTKPHDMFWWHKDFAEQVLTVDRRQYGVIHDNAPKQVKSWEEIGERWYGLIGIL